MKKEFILYEQALALKELGFDEPCFGFYNIKGNFIKDFNITRDIIENLEIKSITFHRKICLAPTFSQAFRWFREKYHIHGEPFYKGGLTKQTSWYDYKIYSNFNWKEDKIQYKIYEEAELECLKKLIEIVKNKQNV